MKKIFTLLGLLLFPFTIGLLFIWPSRLHKDKMKKGWKIFWWSLYAGVGSHLVISKIFAIFLFCVFASNPSSLDGGYSRENVAAPTYSTAEDFHKLTGVEFPEMELVDSLHYNDGGAFGSNWRNEYKFVPKNGLDKAFLKRLNKACKTDSTHWYISEDSEYTYIIYPDVTPVDRSTGMCDRMVEIEEGKFVNDWDGTYVSVELQNDTIILREGWVR
jgi:hypothetical protein